MSGIERNGHWQAGYDDGYKAGWDAQNVIQKSRIAELEAQLAEKEKDAAVGRAVIKGLMLSGCLGMQYEPNKDYPIKFSVFDPHPEGDWKDYFGKTLADAFDAAGLI